MTESERFPSPARPDRWGHLRRFTDARIALGHAGSGLPTAAHLAFQAAHAQARDAVHAPLDVGALMAALIERGWPAVAVASAAPDRTTYLTRPDLGRLLSDESQRRLSEPMTAPDVVLVVGDGLSGTAVQTNALPVLDALVPRLQAAGLRVGPIVVAEQARVALGDPVGALFQAKAAVVLIGERPGLSAADSLGLYLTWEPRPGRVDSERNCISNVRAGGLAPAAAAEQAAALLTAMFARRRSGILLNTTAAAPPPELPD
ncbi:ethanolamine ammonia-lyase subunit EutC [Azospirillum rugosum]|uniref:Ethanolamine ammonia-lyase small subunit n=1 Tax=Azospirillum rugosum TaxID=416170 RepID=A0ABS4STI4_9PROT|nr:ethanolamine ammonia-lyase subunit EutC [Azospirillum rugosum]MBP2295752.1 ethanolamine ammonia-lyase small subunit [Azospirillum rugosum]MDQ0529137.1 ethanolamine ammonia-lyase small subunit [Azospirillum rugosum]